MKIDRIVNAGGSACIARAPEGYDALVLADLVRAAGSFPRGRDSGRAFLHVARDDRRLNALAETFGFFAPEIETIGFPAWDCLPYDRVSPRAEIVARRVAALSRLLEVCREEGPPVVFLTTINAALQRVPPPGMIESSVWSTVPGRTVDVEGLRKFLVQNGFSRTGTVVDPGDYAMRGGIVDVFAPGAAEPVRLDFFGDTLESIRTFDVETQRTTGRLKGFRLLPAGELLLTPEAIGTFRTGYAARFGGAVSGDPLYEAISSGRRYEGMEHWLALFHDGLPTLFDYADWPAISLDDASEKVAGVRQEQIRDFYQARLEGLKHDAYGAAPYKPLPPTELYLSEEEWTASLDAAGRCYRFTPFEPSPTAGLPVISMEGKVARSFASERAEEGGNVFAAFRDHAARSISAGKRVVVACWSRGSLERLCAILRENGVARIDEARSWSDVVAGTPGGVVAAVLGLEAGFETPDLSVVSEQDILGDRLIRRTRKQRRAADFITELSSLAPGDFVVHVDHGIGRFEGLRAIEVQGEPHDCLFLTYRGGDRLFLPVENIELLSRYGSDEVGAQLDRLGGSGWQARKGKLRKRIRDVAEKLIATAAARELRAGEILRIPDEYDEFCARFSFQETDDQAAAIEAVEEDLMSGRPMDRLVCGDVGFGKTEIALRSAFIAAMNGKQVALVVPTTLLARQHFATFRERFRGCPVRIEQASRMVTRRKIDEIGKDLENGRIDVVIGTHALLSDNLKFRDLGLLIIDEEQHFGVKHKERLKEMRAQVHVLTLTATPIPRTLQLALSGVRELSLIATPPIDRLAVRTFISPFDPIAIRETLLREHFRGGQSFFVVPRIDDIEETAAFLKERVPEIKVGVAHGRLPPGQLEDVMSAFCDRAYDVLLSTTIVESGLDIPTANTLVVHRADMFGLAQLYQLRGRVGRSKQRAYALMTVPTDKAPTPAAERRLQVLQSLDSLGAGFSLASHDLDIRGAGNLIGEEQSGHIKEIGFELYREMLEEAVASLRDGVGHEAGEEKWSPNINVGASVLLPESYIDDLQVRMGLYRRLADMEEQSHIDGFAAELRDRFGPMPEEVEHLLEIVAIKLLCRRANVSGVDAGPKGAVVRFRNDTFPNPQGLVGYINEGGGYVKLRPDHRLVVRRTWDRPEDRLAGVRTLLKYLAKLAEAA